jgi:diguanylate cyclase (GGDEF)-like protein
MRWWRWYLAAGLLAIVVGVLLPVVARQVCYAVTGLSTVAAVVAGVRRHRPRPARTWWLICGGLACSVGAALAWGVEFAITGHVDFPTWKDVLFLSAYPFLVGGLVSWVRRDPVRSRWEGLVDAGIVASAVAALSWTIVVDPLLGNDSMAAMRTASYLVYAGCDLAIVVATARLALSGCPRTPSFKLVLAAAVTFLAGDNVYYGMLAWTGNTSGDKVSSLLWITAYLLIGAAALHPSVRTSTGHHETVQAVTTRFRFRMYAVLAVVGPLAAVLRLLAGPGTAGHVAVPLLLSAVTAVLLIARLGLLVRVAHRRAADLDAHARALGSALREQEALRQQLSHRALHDTLTGLGNRAMLYEWMAQRDGTGRSGLVLLDLDGFKDVNDSYGHPAGDALLVDVAERLLGVTSPADTLIRLGGDEFAILIQDTTAPHVQQVASSVVAAIRVPFAHGDRELVVTTSVGTLTVAPGTPAEEALRHADLALYAAKHAGKNQVVAYEPRMSAELRAHLRLVADLRRAVANDEFTVHYQPVVDLETGRVRAVEALLRWSPAGEPVPPDEFVPAAEECGLIVPIGEWVLRRACHDARGWHERFGAAVTVNVSGRQLREPGFAGTVRRALRDSGLPGAALILEITETVLVVVDGAVISVLEALRAEGVRIAVDDFGTGYSSLAYLRRLPVDILKIDRAFTPDEAEAMAFTRAILELGHSLRLESIAEAVETPDQANRLRELHCPLAQGYHFSRPLPADALDGVLTGSAGRLGELTADRAP